MRRKSDILKRMRIAVLCAICLSGSLLSLGCFEIDSCPLDNSVELELELELGDISDGSRVEVESGEILTYKTKVKALSGSGEEQFTLTQAFSSPVEIISGSAYPSGAPCTWSGRAVTCPGIHTVDGHEQQRSQLRQQHCERKHNGQSALMMRHPLSKKARREKRSRTHETNRVGRTEAKE